jgi:hypothetical protein
LAQSLHTIDKDVALTLDADKDGDGIPDSVDECIDVP